MRWSILAPTEPQPWKRWFAWYGVTIDGDMVLFEWIERRRVYPFRTKNHWVWEYRLKSAS